MDPPGSKSEPLETKRTFGGTHRVHPHSEQASNSQMHPDPPRNNYPSSSIRNICAAILSRGSGAMPSYEDRRMRGRATLPPDEATTFAMGPLMICLSTAEGLMADRRSFATGWGSSAAGSEGGREGFVAEVSPPRVPVKRFCCVSVNR